MSRVGIREQLDHLIDALDADFVVNRDAAQAALVRRAEFNAIHRALIFKVDFWFSTGDAIDTSRLARAKPVEVVPGLLARVATPEDAIISKLLWLRQRATERSHEDIRGVLRASAGNLDLAYLEAMVERLGCSRSGHPCVPPSERLTRGVLWPIEPVGMGALAVTTARAGEVPDVAEYDKFLRPGLRNTRGVVRLAYPSRCNLRHVPPTLRSRSVPTVTQHCRRSGRVLQSPRVPAPRQGVASAACPSRPTHGRRRERRNR